MTISFLVAVYFQFGHEALGYQAVDPSLQLILGVAITTTGWVLVTILTPPTSREKLQSFYDKIHPFDRGWRAVVDTSRGGASESISAAFLSWFLGCAVVYGALFGVGFFIYGHLLYGVLCSALVCVAGVSLFRTIPRVGFS